MKRFVDLRGQGTGMRFAWWDTCVDNFEDHKTSMAWSTWASFEEDYEGRQLERYRGLCPDWAFVAPDEDSEVMTGLASEETNFSEKEWQAASDLAVKLLEALGPVGNGCCLCSRHEVLLPNYAMKHALARALFRDELGDGTRKS